VSNIETILKAIIEHPGRKARQIAASLGLDRQEVNSIIYGQLGNMVYQDKDFRWWPRADQTESQNINAKPQDGTPIIKQQQIFITRSEMHKWKKVFSKSLSQTKIEYKPRSVIKRGWPRFLNLGGSAARGR